MFFSFGHSTGVTNLIIYLEEDTLNEAKVSPSSPTPRHLVAWISHKNLALDIWIRRTKWKSCSAVFGHIVVQLLDPREMSHFHLETFNYPLPSSPLPREIINPRRQKLKFPFLRGCHSLQIISPQWWWTQGRPAKAPRAPRFKNPWPSRGRRKGRWMDARSENGSSDCTSDGPEEVKINNDRRRSRSCAFTNKDTTLNLIATSRRRVPLTEPRPVCRLRRAFRQLVGHPSSSIHLRLVVTQPGAGTFIRNESLSRRQRLQI